MRESKKLKTTLEKVDEILKISPESRENDTVLWLQFMVLHHGLATKLGSKFDELVKVLRDPETPSFETVRRVRQKLQETGKHPPCDPKRRRMLANEYKAELAKLDS